MLELLITTFIVLLSVYIIYKNLKKKSSGKCDCGSCSAKCPNRKQN